MPWIDASGSAIHYQAKGPADARPVLLLHELGGSAESWRYIVEGLGDRYVVAMDFPGEASPRNDAATGRSRNWRQVPSG